jgi:hypothetical protein
MEDAEYLKLLRTLIESGAVTVSLDLKKLEHVDSPISMEADSNRWIYALIVIVGGAAWLGGLWPAVGAAAAGAVAWFIIGKPWHSRRMEQRFHKEALHDAETFKKLWRMTGVVMTASGSGANCASPNGNWRAFVNAVTANSPAGTAQAL